MLHRLIAALLRLLRAVVGGGNKEAGQMKDRCAGGGSDGDGKPPGDTGDDDNYPPPPTHDDGKGPKEDITYRDQVVEVNIKSDFEGEITMNEATKKAVDDLKAACDAFLGDPSKSEALKSAMAAVSKTEEVGGSTSGGDAPGTNSPGGGGGLPPFVTVNVNVTKPD
ncbi:MAG: hypothetical protein AAF184_13340 [Pseudomonadota bacterium]